VLIEVDVEDRDDELTLPNGQIVRFKAQATADPDHPGQFRLSAEPSVPISWVRLRGREADEVAGLASLASDLRFAAACCQRLLAQSEGLVDDPHVETSLWRAALIAYRRCFTTGRRKVRAKVPDSVDLRARHEAFLALASGHIAHQVDPFEGFDVFLIGYPVERPEPVGVHVLGAIHQLGTDAQVQNLALLIDAVQQGVERDLARTKSELIAKARSRPSEVRIASASPDSGRSLSSIGGPTDTRSRRRRRSRS
jgi:hypothetical protein